MSEWIDREALLMQIDIDSEGSPGWYGDNWEFIETINNMPCRNDLISRCELFNRLATIPAPPEANDLKAEIYKVIQSMETVDAVPDKAVIIDRCGYCMGASFNDCEECHRRRAK